MNSVTFVDTSVLCELLSVPGKSSPAKSAEVLEEFDVRWRLGERFVIPVTVIIETGNHIAQADGDRVRAAERLVGLLREAMSDEGHWIVLESRWSAEFLASLCDGDSTGLSLPHLAAAKVGAGDIAILVERDRFVATTAVGVVEVWTFDRGLAAHAGGHA
jgi:hypothetical protein